MMKPEYRIKNQLKSICQVAYVIETNQRNQLSLVINYYFKVPESKLL